MSYTLFIQNQEDKIDIALCFNNKLLEYNQDSCDSIYSVGDIYIAEVKKIIPGLNACFVNLGTDKDGFLHYHDLGSKFLSFSKLIDKLILNKKNIFSSLELEPDINKSGYISNVLKEKQKILAQIVKEPIMTKGPRLSSEISMAGRFLVLLPFSHSITVSQKIQDFKEKKRLKEILHKIKIKNFGIIARTMAENESMENLKNDFEDLMENWNSLLSNLYSSNNLTKIYGESSRINIILRNLLNEDFSSIYVDNQKTFDNINKYFDKIFFNKKEILKLHNSKISLFDTYDINKKIKSSFGKIVPVKQGVYLVIEHTEAMHVIDVNSGKKLNKNLDQEQNALEVNLIATEEIARQLRLRDMGGIIVVDFIDMKKFSNRNILFNKMKDALSSDRAKSNILPITRYGLLQITRERVRQEIVIENNSLCEDCYKTTSSLILEIESRIKFLRKNTHKIKIHVNPILHAFLTKGIFSQRLKWMIKFKCIIYFIPSDINLLDIDY